MPESARSAASTGAGKRSESARRGGGAQIAGVALTHPERVLFPSQGLTKLALAHYYEDVANWILPPLQRRPLSLLRCPQGSEETCFFQKHPGQAISGDIPRVSIREKAGEAPYLYVERLADLIGLVQAGTLELHSWGCRVDDLEHPDMLVLDLDPGPGVAWPSVLDAARSLQDRLAQLGLGGFLRTTGGKGLHIVVPLEPRASWDGAKAFARAVAVAHAQDDRGKFTINASKAERPGRIFIDYLRNARGATAIASYSTRAREGAPVAVPVRRDELGASLTSDRYDVDSVRRRLAALRSDPWEGYEQARRPLTRKVLQAVGAERSKR